MPPVLSSQVSMDDKLHKFVEKERDNPTTEVVLFKVILKDSKLVLDSFVNSSAPATVTTLKEAVDPKNPAFYLLRQDTGRWCFVAFVPDSGVPTRIRMQYALCRSDFKTEFGAHRILAEFQFTSMADLNVSGSALTRVLGANSSTPSSGVSAVTGKLRYLSLPEAERRSLLSKTELAREEAHAMENEARDEMANALLQRSSQPTVPLAGLQSGGYHQVALPLQTSAREAVENLNSLKISWLELAVSTAKDGIALVSTKSLSFWTRSTKLPLAETQEPRFYLAVLGEEPKLELEPKVKPDPVPIKPEEDERGETEDNSEIESEPKSKPVVTPKSPVKDTTKRVFVLLYCCPPKSPPRLRMVYSTALGSLISQLQEAGLPLEYKIELFDNLPASQSTLQYLYRRAVDGTDDDGVQRLTAAPKLAHLIQSSHQQKSDAAAEDAYTSAIRPRGSAARPTHPIFGHALPSLASQPTPRSR